MVSDLHLDESRQFALFRESTTKDKDKRAVPLHPSLAAALRAFVPKDAEPTQRVFWKVFPHYETMRADFQRAGIEHKDALGRVLHFHSFRKTWQTLGVRHGVSQRVAQELLGHSDANLTAKVYTDVPALAMHAEIEKLPWFGNNAQIHSQKEPRMAVFRRLLSDLISVAKIVNLEVNVTTYAPFEMVDATGLEPVTPCV